MNSVFLEWKLRKASMYVWSSNQMLKAIEISILTLVSKSIYGVHIQFFLNSLRKEIIP